MGEGICDPFRVQGRALFCLLFAKYINGFLKASEAAAFFGKGGAQKLLLLFITDLS
ncbi:hypothetical protein GOB93_07660 [Acetobacter musti]|uniref:Uncharacterized protein n=1 Tax=Acetobacter musti TaxID=864732 RepID=A0ABX0JSE9_9PROT|nr:hypothetical protein [Acetobacter musti]NHN84519.1 hypothetical protein [Acetobacter musti]